MLTLAALTVVKIAVWVIYLNVELGPWERFARTAPKHRTPELVQRADRCLQSLPVRFSAVYVLTWIATYAAGFLIVRGLGPEHVALPAQADNAIAILCTAIMFGTFAFSFPLTSTLVAESSSECSALARAGGYSLDRSPTSLPLRISAVAIALALGPMLWMVALGYMKQVESSHTERTARAELASGDLSLAISSLDSPAGLSAVFESFQKRNVD